MKFFVVQPITSNFIATLCINYCNDSDVIAMVFFVVINFFCCSVMGMLNSLIFGRVIPMSDGRLP